MLRVLALLATTLPVMTLPARAQEPAAVENAQAQAPAHNPMDCYCRANGRMFAVGEKILPAHRAGPAARRMRHGPQQHVLGHLRKTLPGGVRVRPAPRRGTTFADSVRKALVRLCPVALAGRGFGTPSPRPK